MKFEPEIVVEKLREQAEFFKRWPLYVADPESRVVNDPATSLWAADTIEILVKANKEYHLQFCEMLLEINRLRAIQEAEA